MLKNLGSTLEILKPKLRQYLLAKGTKFSGRLFTCPHRDLHKNQDVKPACNFLDSEETKYFCYVCSSKGDLLDAVHAMEGRPITGSGFHDTVEYLCKLLKVPYEVAEETPESQFIKDVESFLSGMVETGHKNLVRMVKEDPTNPIVQQLGEKGWVGSIEAYRLGTIIAAKEPRAQKLKDICKFLNLDVNDLPGSIIIPITFQHHIIGFQLRKTAVSAQTGQKYKTYLSTTKGLFNLDGIDPTQPVYVVEGASSVIVLNSFGIKNVVATLGNGFNVANYESLVGREVKKIVVVYDNDDGGTMGRNKVCSVVVGKHDMEVAFKLLPDVKDPADYALAGKDLNALPEVSTWEYLKSLGNKELLLKDVAAQRDLIIKEQRVAELAKQFSATKVVIMEEVQKLEPISAEVPTVMVLKEKEALVESINAFEKWAWSRGSLLGVKSFDSFDKNFDGVQDGLILVSGAPNVGKSALLTTWAIKILEQNPDTYVVYMSIDDSALTTTARFLANLSGIPINVVSNPKYRIVENKYFTDAEKTDLMVRREKALAYLRNHVHMFNLKDAEQGHTIEYINTLFKSIEPMTKGKKLVFFLDNLHKLRSERDFKSDKSMVDMICGNLKVLSSVYKCPVICTVEHTKSAIQLGEVGGSAIKETSSLHYDASLILTVVMKQVVGSFKLMDVIASKNKFSTFIGSLPFKLYPEQSKMEESALAEDGLK